MFKFNPTVQNLVYQKTTRSIRYTHIFFFKFSAYVLAPYQEMVHPA